MRRAWQVAKRSAVSFYDDQATHHAAALTYYALMSLFPTLLLAVSLLGLLGEFPATYDAIVGHLRGVVPTATLAPLDAAVRAALKSKSTAAAGLVVAIVTALYGATGYLEAARRALNVVFKALRGRSFRCEQSRFRARTCPSQVALCARPSPSLCVPSTLPRDFAAFVSVFVLSAGTE